MEISLYVHVPFCNGACDYCDFYSIAAKPGDSKQDQYVGAILLEGERFLKMNPFDMESSPPPDSPDVSVSIPTVYIGGGTPSILGPRGITRLLDGLSDLVARFSSSPPVEISLEANPETVDEAFLNAILEGGVSRLSIGIQTFHGPSRRAVNRIGDETLLARKLAMVGEYFPGAFSADLMSGLPFQDDTILRNDIAEVLLYKPAHISLYALSTKMKIPLSAPDQDEADRIWLCGRDFLEKSGYRQYEVSNFCLEGKESQHNIRYWHMKSWYGLGPAASGTIISDEKGRGFRYTIPFDVDLWLASKGSWFGGKHKCSPKVEDLDTLTLIKESLLMGFRYIEGPDEDLFRRRFRLDIKDLIPKTLNAWREKGSFQEGRTALTKDGLLFLNRFLLDAFDELDVVFST